MTGFSALPVRHPGVVLTTWNLLNSAALLEDPEREHIPLSSVQDLAALIDMYCLYDEAAVVGRGIGSVTEHRALHHALREANFLRIVDGFSEPVVSTWVKHLALFMGKSLDALANTANRQARRSPWYAALFNHVSETPYVDRYSCDKYTKRLFRGAMEQAIIDLGGPPDFVDTDDPRLATPEARRVLVAELLFESGQWSRTDTFVLRSFLYLAHADVENVPFIPDFNRQHIIESATVRAAEYRATLARQLQIAMTEAVATSVPDGQVFRRLPPLSTVVFERARSREGIISQMVSLREELAPLRQQLARLEDDIYHGSADQAKDADSRWQRAVEEVSDNFGLRPRLWSWRGAAKFAEQLGGTVDKPTSYASWTKALAALPVDVISRLVRRRTVVGLHRLSREIPAAGTLRETLERLFSPY